MNEHKESNITVKRIRMTAEAKKELLANLNANGVASVDVSEETVGYVETPKGFYLITNEGTGSTIPLPTKKFTYGVYTKSTPESFSLIPIPVEFEENEIEVYEELPLEFHIRSFGARLASNLKAWRDFLSKELGPPMEEESSYRIAFALESGEFEVVESFTAACDSDANEYAEREYAEQEWYVLDADGNNINSW